MSDPRETAFQEGWRLYKEQSYDCIYSARNLAKLYKLTEAIPTPRKVCEEVCYLIQGFSQNQVEPTSALGYIRRFFLPQRNIERLFHRLSKQDVSQRTHHLVSFLPLLEANTDFADKAKTWAGYLGRNFELSWVSQDIVFAFFCKPQLTSGEKDELVDFALLLSRARKTDEYPFKAARMHPDRAEQIFARFAKEESSRIQHQWSSLLSPQLLSKTLEASVGLLDQHRGFYEQLRDEASESTRIVEYLDRLSAGNKEQLTSSLDLYDKAKAKTFDPSIALSHAVESLTACAHLNSQAQLLKGPSDSASVRFNWDPPEAISLLRSLGTIQSVYLTRKEVLVFTEHFLVVSTLPSQSCIATSWRLGYLPPAYRSQGLSLCAIGNKREFFLRSSGLPHGAALFLMRGHAISLLSRSLHPDFLPSRKLHINPAGDYLWSASATLYHGEHSVYASANFRVDVATGVLTESEAAPLGQFNSMEAPLSICKVRSPKKDKKLQSGSVLEDEAMETLQQYYESELSSKNVGVTKVYYGFLGSGRVIVEASDTSLIGLHYWEASS